VLFTFRDDLFSLKSSIWLQENIPSLPNKKWGECGGEGDT